MLAEQLAQLQLDQLQQLLVVHHVDLVEEDHHGRHLHLARQQHVLAGLGHRAVGGRDDQDRAVHLGRAGDHVLDVVGVAGAVDVGVVALVGLVLDVANGDGDAALALFGRVVDLVVGGELGRAAQRQHLGDGGGQRGLAVVDVPDRAHVHMRLGALKFLLCHNNKSPCSRSVTVSDWRLSDWAKYRVRSPATCNPQSSILAVWR